MKAVRHRAANMLNQTSTLSTVMNLNSDVFLSGFLITGKYWSSEVLIVDLQFDKSKSVRKIFYQWRIRSVQSRELQNLSPPLFLTSLWELPRRCLLSATLHRGIRVGNYRGTRMKLSVFNQRFECWNFYVLRIYLHIFIRRVPFTYYNSSKGRSSLGRLQNLIIISLSSAQLRPPFPNADMNPCKCRVASQKGFRLFLEDKRLPLFFYRIPRNYLQQTQHANPSNGVHKEQYRKTFWSSDGNLCLSLCFHF